MLFQVVCFILPHNPCKPHGGDRVGLGTAAEQGIEAYSEGLSSLSLRAQPSSVLCRSLHDLLAFPFLFFSLAPKNALFPLKASLQWQFFDQSYSCHLLTTG